MKAPLRFAFGWVIYLGIFAAINYPMAVIWEAVKAQPILLFLLSCLSAVGVFIWLLHRYLFRLWDWCDEPRSQSCPSEV